MSLLTIFGITFETDADDATAETRGFTGALREAEGAAEGATDGVDGLTEAQAKQAKSAEKLVNSLGKLVASYFAIKVISSQVMNNAANIDSMGKFTQTVGLNIAELDAWGAAAERNGGSAEAFRGTVEGLQSSLQELEITGGGEIINTLAMIGVQATTTSGEVKGAFDLLPEIAEAFKGMSAAKSFAFGKKLGLDQGTILTLQQSRYEVDKLVARQKLLSGVTKEGYEAAALFNDQWDDTKRVFNSLWLSANSTILPMLQDVLKGFESVVLFVRDNKELVAGFFATVAGVIVGVYLPAITAAATATALAAAPFIALGLAAAAIGLAVTLVAEDIQKWVDGSKSAIGSLIGTFDEFKTKITGAFDSIAKKFTGFADKLADVKKEISDFFSGNFSGGLDIQANMEQSDAIAGKAQEGSERYDPEAANSNKQIDYNTARAQAQIASYSSTQLNQGGSTMNQRTQNFNVNVGGAKIDARGMTTSQAAKAFSSGINSSIEATIGQLADGVDR